MKQLIVFILVFSIHSSYAQARHEASASNCATKAVPSPDKEEGVSTIEKITKKVEENDLELLAAEICTSIPMLKSSGEAKAGEKIEDAILQHLNITRKAQDYKLKVSSFWNKNSDKLICKHNTHGLRTPQHFMKRVVDLQMYKKIFYDFLLYDEEEYPVTVNAVEIYNGKKETVLDYLDNILADPSNKNSYDFSEIKLLREVLIDDYGAKKATEI